MRSAAATKPSTGTARRSKRRSSERTQELRLARDAAESANEAKSSFLATMSHEIRTPLNGLMVMAELLAGAGLDQRLQRYAEVIVKSGQSLLTIINDILDLSKIEAGKLAARGNPGQSGGHRRRRHQPVLGESLVQGSRSRGAHGARHAAGGAWPIRCASTRSSPISSTTR